MESWRAVHLAECWRAILLAQLRVSRAQLTDDALLVEDLGADSLDCIELVMKIEEATDTEIDDAAVERAVAQGTLRTVKDAELWILDHLTKSITASK